MLNADMDLTDEMQAKLSKLIKEGEIIKKSPSFKYDFRSWKRKARLFINKVASERIREKAAKITKKDAFHIYLWETNMDDLEKQAISHYKWQLENLMAILKSMK